MSLERSYSLSAAAKVIGVRRVTLKKWLASDLAMVLPEVPRGSKVLIRESDLELIVRKRSPRSDWTLLRGKGRDAA